LLVNTRYQNATVNCLNQVGTILGLGVYGIKALVIQTLKLTVFKNQA